MPKGLGINEAPGFNVNMQYRPLANNSGAALGDIGVKGGNSTSGVMEAPQFGSSRAPDNALPEFFNALLGDRIQAVKRQKFYEGFAQARAGKTLEDIQKDSPWYAKVFGDTEFESGATAYTASASVAELAREMQENMDDLKKLSPTEMGQWMNDKSQGMLTGDVFADSIIQKNFLDHSGPLLEMQAKANYAWKQEELSTSQYNNMMSQARAYQSSENAAWQFGQEHPDQLPDDATGAQERGRMLFDAFAMPEGQNEESYQKNLENWAYGAAREGLWHAVNAMQTTGLYSRLPVDQQERIEKRLATLKNQWLSNMAGTPDMQDAAKIVAGAHSGLYSAEETAQRAAEFNKKFTARTGYPDAYFDNDDLQSLQASAGEKTYAAWMRKQEKLEALRAKAQTQADKDAADAAEAAHISKAIQMGSVGDYLAMPGSNEKKAEYAVQQTVNQMVASGNPEGALSVLESNFNNVRNRYVSKSIQQQLQNATAAGAGYQYNDAIGGAYEMWKNMFYRKRADGTEDGAGPAMASTYFGDKADDMFAFDQLVKAGVGHEVAYQKVFGKDAQYGEGDLRGGQGEKINQAALDAAVGELSPGLFGRVMGGQVALSDGSKKLIAFKSSQFFEQMLKQRPDLPPKIIAKQAVNHFLTNGGEIAGRFAWSNGPKTPGIAKSLGMPPDVFGTIMDTALTNKFRKQGLRVDDDTSFEVLRLPDDKDGVRMLVTGYSDDGTMKAVALTGKDFRSLRDQWNERMGQSNTSLTKDDPALQMIGF